MALSTGAFPYDIANLLGGAVRILYADPETVAVPGDISDVIDMQSPYASQTGWTDLGATRDAFSYSRSFDTEGYEIQQVAGNVIEELTDITRSIEISFADFRPEHLKMIENAPNIDTIGPVAHATDPASEQKRIGFGSFSSIEQYRFAFIAKRPKQAGVVVEGDLTERGRFFMGVANLAQIAADEVSFEQEKGTLTAAGVTFTLFPDSTEAEGEEYGAWFDELAGTLDISP
jgi:hypothetical protein